MINSKKHTQSTNLYQGTQLYHYYKNNISELAVFFWISAVIKNTLSQLTLS